MPQDSIFQLRTLIDILLSVILGFAIGFERKSRSKEAGIRTHALVALGSCLIMIISQYAFVGDADTSRVAAQIVAGVGFLGAGMIVYKKREITGLTTAAGIWATAGVGMACGGRLYVLAVGATIIIVVVQYLFHLNIKPFTHKNYHLLKVDFLCEDGEEVKIKELFSVDKFIDFSLKKDDGKIIYSAVINSKKEYSPEELTSIMKNNSFIFKIEKIENE